VNMRLSINDPHGERLVKIHMANITTASGRICETNLSIQIRSIKVYLTTILMDNLARLLNAVLKHTKGRRVCDLGNKMRVGTSVIL